MSGHTRLDKLWHQMIQTDNLAVAINVDMVSYREITEHRSWMDSFSTDNMGHQHWRKIRLTVVHPRVPERVPGEQIDPGLTFKTPLCVTMLCKKPNGRYIYLDDPDTDEEYL